MLEHPVSPVFVKSAKDLKVSVEQAEISAAATALGKTGRLVLPNGESITPTELRVVGAAPDAKKQEALDALLKKKGYPAGSVELQSFALMCGDLAQSKNVSSCVPKSLFKADTQHAAPLPPPAKQAKQAPTVDLPAVHAGGADAAPPADGALRLTPPSDASKQQALALLQKNTLTFADQKQLFALAMTMLPKGFEDDAKAQTAALTGLLRVLNPAVDADDAEDAARVITRTVRTYKYEPSAAPSYELTDSLHTTFAPNALAMAQPRQLDANKGNDAEKIVAKKADARQEVWTPKMIEGTPYAFANALTQVDGDKATRADQTQCGPMSLIGAVALKDPAQLPAMAKAILGAPSFFAEAQNAPFKAALERIQSGSFTPADCNLMARAIYASMKHDDNATTGLTDDELVLVVKSLGANGVVFPKIEIHHYAGSDPTSLGHFNGVADRNFDPWPGEDGNAVIQTREEAKKRHEENGRNLLSRIVIEGRTGRIS